LESRLVALQSEGKQLLFGCNYDLQTEAVRELIFFSDYTYFSEMSLEDCCIQTKKPKTLKLGTQVSTTLPYMEMHRDIGNSGRNHVRL